jgi:hypothetical protein
MGPLIRFERMNKKVIYPLNQSYLNDFNFCFKPISCFFYTFVIIQKVSFSRNYDF